MLKRKVFPSAEINDSVLGGNTKLLRERHRLAIDQVIEAAKALSEDQKRKQREIGARAGAIGRAGKS